LWESPFSTAVGKADLQTNYQTNASHQTITADVGGAPYVRYWWVDSGGSREFFSRFGKAPYQQLWVTGSGRAVAINVDKAFAGVGSWVGFIFFFESV